MEIQRILMNKCLRLFGFFIAFYFVVASLGYAEETWQQHMQKLGATLSDLLPQVLSKKKFLNPKNKEKIAADIEALSHLSHGLAKPQEMTSHSPDADPSIPILLGTFEGTIREASNAFNSGNQAYARHLLQNVTGYCVTCHTRTNQGVTQRVIALNPNLKNLTSFEMAQYLTATRRFDDALNAYSKIINDKAKPKNDLFEWLNALRYSLAITIRFNHDTNASLGIIEEALRLPTVPAVTKLTILHWKNSLETWKKETPVTDLKPSTIKEKIKELLAQGETLKKYPDDAGLIVYLRASALAHDLLRMAPAGAQVAEGLYYAGRAHASLREGPVFFMPEMYFEACIKQLPHSSMAKTCYKEYSDRTILNYSGTAGTLLPEGVQEEMDQLKKIAY
jgi:hypothetical protein